METNYKHTDHYKILTLEQAKEAFDLGIEVYELHADGGESLIENGDEIAKVYLYGKDCGIELTELARYESATKEQPTPITPRFLTVADINNVADIKLFIRQIIAEGTQFDPAVRFEDYIIIDSTDSVYKWPEAQMRNTLLERCWETLDNYPNVDFHELCIEAMKDTGMWIFDGNMQRISAQLTTMTEQIEGMEEEIDVISQGGGVEIYRIKDLEQLTEELGEIKAAIENARDIVDQLTAKN